MQKLKAIGTSVYDKSGIIARCNSEKQAQLFAIAPELLLLAQTIKDQFIDQGMTKDSLRVIMIDQILNKL